LAFEAASKVFRRKSGGSVDALSDYSLTYGGIYVDGAFLDQALMLKMKAPHSFTGEDVAELQCHGGPLVMGRLLAALTSLDELPVRPAAPGEFSRRAFLNGKLDLSQAEAVMELVSADNPKAVFLAADQLGGGLSRQIGGMKAGIMGLLAEIEADVDFPDEDLGMPHDWLGMPDVEASRADRVSLLLEETDAILAMAERGRVYRDGIRAVLYGRPNAGKSSLLNGMLQEQRAIVTPEPGTTRDVLEERVVIKGLPLLLADTAGIRHAGSLAEQAGVERARQAAEKADLVLYVVDITAGITDEDRAFLREMDREKTLIVFNKADLLRGTEAWGDTARSGVAQGGVAQAGAMQGDAAQGGAAQGDAARGDAARGDVAQAGAMQGGEPCGDTPLGAAPRQNRGDALLPAEFAGWPYCCISALEPSGLAILAERIGAFFELGGVVGQNLEMLLNQRQSEALMRARQALASAKAALAGGTPEDIASIDIRQAWTCLGELTGETAQPALVDAVFSKFCLGK
jgi:tRNA modification GTPase